MKNVQTQQAGGERGTGMAASWREAGSIVPVSLPAQPGQLVFDHGAPVGLELAVLTETESANGQDVGCGQTDDRQQDEEENDPVGSIKVDEALLFRIGWWPLAVHTINFALFDQFLR